MNKDHADLFTSAFEYMFENHKGQYRYDGQPYFIHPLQIALSFSNGSIKTKVVALFHDLIEDTEVTYNELSNKWGPGIADSVLLLTHEEGVYYFDYIQDIIDSGDLDALMVKFEDLKHNLATISNIPDLDKQERLRIRYIKAKNMILGTNQKCLIH